MLKIDTFSEIGSQHKICEDYCIGQNEPFPLLILSDGCSSSKNTDMGARIICHLTKQYITQNQQYLNKVIPSQLGDWVIHNAQMTAKNLGLSEECLDATLIIAYYVKEENCIRIIVFGDGDIIHQTPNGTIFRHHIHYKPNAPYYLSYRINMFRNQSYHQMKVDKTILLDGVKTETVAYDQPYVMNIFLDMDEFPKILICTDGIESFLKDVVNPVTEPELKYILNGFLSFKTTTGEFLKRRATNALKKLTAENFIHYDDLTIGAILKE
jgi:hypothetical protein